MAANRSALICPALCAALLVGAPALANPAVLLEDDPRMLVCSKNPPGTLTPSGTATSLAQISASGVLLYQAAFDAATDSGSLRKFKLSIDGHGALARSSAAWDAADILTGMTAHSAVSTDMRHMYTSRVAQDGAFVTIPFVWDQLSATQQSMLNSLPLNGANNQLGRQRLDYLRGERKLEVGRAGGIFRARRSLLGSIVNSNPVFVGAPSGGLPGAGYQTFLDENKRRLPVVFVGANDGALHAFNALGGEELFAYIPRALFAGLSYLTQAGKAHRAYADGPITVAEARVGTQWKTVLLAGMGGGAQGVFALDVTQPEKFGRDPDSGALWEFTDEDDADIGNVIGLPLIAKLRVAVVKGVPQYRYFALVAGGLNSYRDDGSGRFNAGASGALFLLALDKEKSARWVAGVNYFKFVLPPGDAHLANGLSAPAIVLDGDGAVSHAYAGDLQGNLWRFDFDGGMPPSNVSGNKALKPVFIAMDDDGNRQPITQQAKVVFGPGGYIVLFGTGKYLERADSESAGFRTQSFYGILDTLARGEKPIGRRQLARRVLSAAGPAGGMLEINGGELAYDMPGAGGKGWYLDFIASRHTGERSVSAAQIVDDMLFFNTFIPNADPCAQASGRAYTLNTLSGLPPGANQTGYIAAGGMLRSPLLLEAHSGKTEEPDPVEKNRIHRKIERLDGASGVPQGESAPDGSIGMERVTKIGRLSWREIVNWIDLHASPNGR